MDSIVEGGFRFDQRGEMMLYFRKSLSGILCIAAWALPAGAATPAEEVRAFVSRLYVHGLPFEEARTFDGSALPELQRILADRGQESYWANAVMTIGFIGDPRGSQILTEFLGAQRGEVSPEAFRALLSVPHALGHLARQKDGAALARLEGWSRPGAANSFEWRHGRYQGGVLADLYGRVAVKGLGISGTDEAAARLRELAADAALPESWRDDVQESSELLARVRSESPEAIFASPEVDR